MTSPIMPSVGRIVLINTDGYKGDAPAIVTHVHSQGCINVMIFPDQGEPYPMSSVLYAEDHREGGTSISFHWMDYQLKVAAERDPGTGELAEVAPVATSVRDDGVYVRQRGMEYAIEVWKSLPQKDRDQTTVVELAEKYVAFIIGPPPTE